MKMFTIFVCNSIADKQEKKVALLYILWRVNRNRISKRIIKSTKFKNYIFENRFYACLTFSSFFLLKCVEIEKH